MRGFADPDANVGHDAGGLLGQEKADAPAAAQIAAVVAAVHPQRRREFARPGTKRLNRTDRGRRFRKPPAGHQMEPPRGFDGSEQDEPVLRSAFDQDVQHPVHAIIKIDVGGAWPMFGDKSPRRWPHERMGSFVVDRGISFRLDDDAGAVLPRQRAADQLPRARQRIALKESALYPTADGMILDWLVQGEG